jgi:hypothetical protein
MDIDDMSTIVGTMLTIGIILGFVLFVCAWCIYGFKGALLVSLILCFLTNLAALTGLVPVGGPFIYWWLEKTFVIPTFFDWFSFIEPSWIITIIFWGGLAASLFYTILSCSLILLSLKGEL